MPLLMWSFISHYSLLYLFICIFIFSYFRSFDLFMFFPYVYLLVCAHFTSSLPSSFVFLAYFIFLLLSFFISLSLFYFFASICFSSLVVNAMAAVYSHHFISKIRSEISTLNRCSFHVCQFEFA